MDVVLAKLISAKHEQKYDANAPTVLPANIRMEIQNWEDNDVFDTTKKIYPQLQRIFSPETLGAATTTSITGINGKSREVWFYGDSLMIGLYAQDFKSDQDGKQKAIDILKELLE